MEKPHSSTEIIAELVDVVNAWHAQMITHHDIQRDELRRLLNKVVKLREDMLARDRVRRSLMDPELLKLGKRLLVIESSGDLSDIENDPSETKNLLLYAITRYQESERKLGLAKEEIKVLKAQLRQAKGEGSETPSSGAEDEGSPRSCMDKCPKSSFAGEGPNVHAKTDLKPEAVPVMPKVLDANKGVAAVAFPPMEAGCSEEQHAVVISSEDDEKSGESDCVTLGQKGKTEKAQESKVPNKEEENLANFPGALDVHGWRHQIQRTFLSHSPPTELQMSRMEEIFTTLEAYDMKPEHLQFSKILKVMRHLIAVDPENIPGNSEHRYIDRAKVLSQKWIRMLKLQPADVQPIPVPSAPTVFDQRRL